MSLDWNADKVPANLRTYKWGEGEDEKQLHPKMELMIWLTLTLRMSYDGKQSAKDEVLKRVQYIREKEPRLLTLYVSDDHQKDHPAVWQGAQDGKYILTDSDILERWGLWTNAYYSDTKSFNKWKAWFDKKN